MALSHIENLAELEWNEGEWGITVHTVSASNKSNNNHVGGRKQIFVPIIHSWRHLINHQTWLICGTGLCSILFYNRFTTQDIMLENEKKKLLKKQFILLDTKKL